MIRKIVIGEGDSSGISGYKERHGCHFSRKLADYAVSELVNADGSKHRFTEETLRTMLKSMSIHEPEHMGDLVYLSNWIYSDLYPVSVKNEQDIVRGAVKLLADPDGYEGMAMKRWLFDMREKGKEVDLSAYM